MLRLMLDLKELKMDVPSDIGTCVIGSILKDEKCHLLTYSKNLISYNLEDLSDEDLLLLRYRLNYHQELKGKICSFHRGFYILYYGTYTRKCSDPFNLHAQNSTKITQALRPITLRQCQDARSNSITVIPGDKLCPTCENKLNSLVKNYKVKQRTQGETTVEKSPVISEISFTTSNLSEFATASQANIDLVHILKYFGLDFTSLHLDITKLPKDRRSKAVESIGANIYKQIVEKLHTACNLDGLALPISRNLIEDTSAFIQMINSVKSEFEKAITVTEKLRYLMILPEKWSHQEVCKYLPVSRYIYDELGKLRNNGGNLEIRKKKIKRYSDALVKKIKDYYIDEQNCFTCPGKKQFIKCKLEESGRVVHKQKKLLLFTLKELYENFLEQNKDEERLPKFTFFYNCKPPECIYAGDSGTHMICVCVQHENIKLKLRALPIKIKYRDLLENAVCDTSNIDCMLHRCVLCPGIEGLKKGLDEELSPILSGMKKITYQHWQSAGTRANLVTLTENLAQYKKNLLADLWKLTIHHYIAGSQQETVKTCKANLQSDTCILQMDFSENYSFIIQNSVHAYYYNNTQATVHPIIMYYKTADNDQVKHVNFCVISDCKDHQAFTVNAFLKKCMVIIREEFSWIKKVIYFSDGAPTQYKNKNNLINMYYHKDDFGLNVVSCNFFATDHGKHVCDAVGGVVKRTVMRHCIRSGPENQITNATEMFDHVSENMETIRAIWVSDTDVQKQKRKLNKRFDSVKTFEGTRKLHCFIPKVGKLEAKICSNDDKLVTFELENDE